jgi:hypothetical protein
MATSKNLALKKALGEIPEMPFFDVSVVDPRAVHLAISQGRIPLDAAPINLDALHRWTRGKYDDDAQEFGLEIRRRERGVKP